MKEIFDILFEDVTVHVREDFFPDTFMNQFQFEISKPLGLEVNMQLEKYILKYVKENNIIEGEFVFTFKDKKIKVSCTKKVQETFEI